MDCKSEKGNYPHVLVSDKVKDAKYVDNLAKMMKIDNTADVNEVLSIIFSKLGFDSKDNIAITEVISDAYDMVRLGFTINEKKIYKGLFHRRYGRDCFGFSLVDDKQSQFNYRCDLKNGEDLDVSMLLKGYTYKDGEYYIICRRGFDGVEYCFVSPNGRSEMTEQHVILNIKCPEEVTALNKEKGEYYTPKNERVLMIYLYNRRYPIEIDKVFQNVVNLCFDGDISNLPLFDFHVMTVRRVKDREEREVTDIIKMKNGMVESFGMLHPKATVGSEVETVGASVTFIGNKYYNYHALIPRNGFASVTCAMIGEVDRIIDPNVVNEVKEKLVMMFPVDAERMLGLTSVEEIELRSENDENQLSLFDSTSTSKQLKKSDDLKRTNNEE